MCVASFAADAITSAQLHIRFFAKRELGHGAISLRERPRIFTVRVSLTGGKHSDDREDFSYHQIFAPRPEYS